MVAPEAQLSLLIYIKKWLPFVLLYKFASLYKNTDFLAGVTYYIPFINLLKKMGTVISYMD